VPISNELFVFDLSAHADSGRLVGDPEVITEVALGPVYDVGGVVKSSFHTTETNLQRDELRLAELSSDEARASSSSGFLYGSRPRLVSSNPTVQLLPPTMYSIFNH
jgi:hypothetical protein